MLDLGCGNGAKTARLAARFDVVGVDLSEEQLRLARAAVPDATFVQADFAELDFPAGSFDAVTAFYSVMHVPRDEHPASVREDPPLAEARRSLPRLDEHPRRP